MSDKCKKDPSYCRDILLNYAANSSTNSALAKQAAHMVNDHKDDFSSEELEEFRVLNLAACLLVNWRYTSERRAEVARKALELEKLQAETKEAEECYADSLARFTRTSL